LKILAADTAAESCSVAVVDGKATLAEITIVRNQTHSRHLMGLIEQTLALAGIDLQDLDGFAVSKGPGSFTGLRIGLSTIKGLAVARARPLAGISTLEALAWQCGPVPHLICAMMDARRGEVYFSLFRHRDGSPVSLQDERALAPAAVAESIRPPCVFIGSGAVLHRDDLLDRLGDGAIFPPAHFHLLRAATIARLAHRRLEAGDADDTVALAPVYIRKSDAELNARRRGRR
jgi:tRNA threonylcarbamoyladenosine biosynthesis protein TsaB